MERCIGIAKDGAEVWAGAEEGNRMTAWILDLDGERIPLDSFSLSRDMRRPELDFLVYTVGETLYTR